MELQAPIVAVTVHPRRARVTRRGRVTVGAGATELVVTPLPESLLDDSVRVSGRSAAPMRVVGVDLVRRDLVDAPDERVRAAEDAVRDAERALAELDGVDAGDAAREEMLQRLARSSGHRLAVALAEGAVDATRVTDVGVTVAAELVSVAASRRATAERRTAAVHAHYAAQAELDRLHSSGRQRREAVVSIETDAAGEVEVELTYVVDGASWSSAYDARLTGERVTLTWYGMITQSTGEDWPSSEVTLSTARPAVTAVLPELTPWWIDVERPPPPPMPMMAAAPAAMARGRAGGFGAADVAMAKAESVEAVAVPDGPGVSASWRLARPTAVPADGTPHRTTVTTFEADARLDHLTAPVLGPEVHLRATVVNTAGQVLLAGPVSTFSGDAYVGTTRIEITAPGAEVELALGLDDQVTVERELAERTTHKARFGANRGAVQRFTVLVTNHRSTAARVTVLDRLPVSRVADVKIVDVAVTPEPAERDDLGRIEWVATIPAGAKWEGSIRCGIEYPKDTPVVGWS